MGSEIYNSHNCWQDIATSGPIKISYSFQLKDDESCFTCKLVLEDVEHVLLHSPPFADERESLQVLRRQQFPPETSIEEMFASEIT